MGTLNDGRNKEKKYASNNIGWNFGNVSCIVSFIRSVCVPNDADPFFRGRIPIPNCSSELRGCEHLSGKSWLAIVVWIELFARANIHLRGKKRMKMFCVRCLPRQWQPCAIIKSNWICFSPPQLFNRGYHCLFRPIKNRKSQRDDSSHFCVLSASLCLVLGFDQVGCKAI